MVLNLTFLVGLLNKTFLSTMCFYSQLWHSIPKVQSGYCSSWCFIQGSWQKTTGTARATPAPPHVTRDYLIMMQALCYASSIKALNCRHTSCEKQDMIYLFKKQHICNGGLFIQILFCCQSDPQILVQNVCLRTSKLKFNHQVQVRLFVDQSRDSMQSESDW